MRFLLEGGRLGNDLRAVTYNPTSWGTFMSFLGTVSPEIDIILVQETHLHDPLRVAAATSSLAGRGWHSFFSPAALLPSGLSSGGTSVLVRSNRVGHALHGAAAVGHVEVTNALLSFRADTCALNRDGKSALERALEVEEEDIVAVLSEHSGHCRKSCAILRTDPRV